MILFALLQNHLPVICPLLQQDKRFVMQTRHRDRRQLSQRVAWRQANHHLPFGHRQHFQVLYLIKQHYKANIQLALLEQTQDGNRAFLDHRQFVLRIQGGKRGEHFGKQKYPDHRRDSDPDRARLPQPVIVHLRHGVIDPAEDLIDPAQKHAAFDRQSDIALAAVEQCQPQFGLQLVDRGGHRRLSDKQLFRRLSDAL